ncbi:hypothetical protein WG8_0851 [Paenibacillus sp. Aloe-11]|nr:hypothetical protein WG8_0851 [Paenibacillus sp. Aloe-11]
MVEVKVVLRGPLRVWKVLPIAVAAGFLDWNNPFQGWNSAAKANAFASPESFHPLRFSVVHPFAAEPVPLLFPRGRG